MSIDSILDRYEATSPTVTVDIDGEACLFASLKDASVMWRVEKDATKFASQCTDTPLAEWEPFLPIDPDVAKMVWRVHEMSHEPKVTLLQALRMAKVAGPMVARINAEIAASMEHVAEAESEAIASLGEPSNETP